MLELIFTLASAVASFPTGVAVFATYVGIPYLSGEAAYYVTLFVTWGTLAFGAYVLFNALDATTPQRSWGLYYLSLISSVWAMLWITATSLIVFYQMATGGHLQQLRDITGAQQLLIGLALFSWFDVFYLQRRKLMHLRAGRGAPPVTSPISGPAQPQHWGAVLSVLLLALVIGVVAMFAIGVKIPGGQLAFRKDTPPATQQQPPAPSTTAKGPATPSAPPATRQDPTPTRHTGWQTDINRPLGPEWRDVTGR